MAAHHGYWDAGARRWERASGTATGPLRDPHAIVASAEEVRRRIDREFGAEHLEARFAFFRSVLEAATMPGYLLAFAPIGPSLARSKLNFVHHAAWQMA